jgi:hypothetical protein
MAKSKRFGAVNYPVVGDSYASRSKPLSQQNTLNMYPEITEGGRTDLCLQSWPGIKETAFNDPASVLGNVIGYDRGMHSQLFQDKIYQVSGTLLYRTDINGVRTQCGAIPGTDQVTFADDGTNLLIAADDTIYKWVDNQAIVELTFSFTPKTVSYLNGKFLYGASDGRVYISTPGLTTVVDGNSYSPDSNPDSLVRPYAFDQFVFNFNKSSIEPWEDIGERVPSLARMPGAIIESRGLASEQAVTDTGNAIYFLGNDAEPYSLTRFNADSIGQPGVVNAFQSYTISDCRLQRVGFDNQWFVIFIFPTDKKVWVYSEATKLWFQLDHGAFGDLYRGNSFQRLFGKNFIADRSTGKLHVLDLNTFQNIGAPMIRERTMRPISGEQFNNPRQMNQLNEIRFSLETGVGNTDAPLPRLMTAISTDGVIFDNEIWHNLGREGERQQDVRHNSNKYFTDLVCRIRYSENTKFALYTAGVLMREAGR